MKIFFLLLFINNSIINNIPKIDNELNKIKKTVKTPIKYRENTLAKIK